MKRYVIVSLINGEPQRFHEELVEEVCSKFRVSPQKLPMHITLKAPFEIENIKEIEELTRKFSEKNNEEKIEIKGFGHFRDNVIFIDIIPSKGAVELHERYYNSLKSVKNLEWKNNEGPSRKFHCTVVSRRISDKFSEIWDFVKNRSCSYESELDNITIMEYNFQKYKWEVYKIYKLKK